jgi:UDP-N-acetylmuramoyl-tripeptide--D-alanyl-D-alanine ligase
MRWTQDQIARALDVVPPEGLDPLARVAGVSIDSRNLRPGELFFAIRGPRNDGHDYVAKSLALGAAAAVVSRERWAALPAEIRGRALAVEDTGAALQQLAREVCREWRVARPARRVAAITGSAGKTTTKEILAALLGARLRVLKSEGNLNNAYGLPLTLLRLEEEHEVVVAELGMSRRGELAQLARIAEPEAGIVTTVAAVHLEYFSSVDEIAAAKRELIEGLCGPSPFAVLNADDARVTRFSEGFSGRVARFGFGPLADFRAENIEDRGLEGSEFDFVSSKGRARLLLPLAGRHNLANALAALAAASDWGIGAAEAAEVFPNLQPAALRGEVLRFATGVTLYNDCYNANPASFARLIELAAATPGFARRILVAGAMLEMGPTGAELHRQVGFQAAQSDKLDWILGVGAPAQPIIEGAVAAGYPAAQTKYFSGAEGAAEGAAEEAAEFLAGVVRAGDLVLVKGSRGMHLEKIAEFLREKLGTTSAGSAEGVPVSH